jgi:hypothetical protein
MFGRSGKLTGKNINNA